VIATADTIIFHDELYATIRKLAQENAHFAGSIGIGILEGVGDPFRQHHAKADACVSAKLDRLEIMAKRSAVALVPHRTSEMFQQAR
jgi:hypothetical protein